MPREATQECPPGVKTPLGPPATFSAGPRTPGAEGQASDPADPFPGHWPLQGPQQEREPPAVLTPVSDTRNSRGHS